MSASLFDSYVDYEAYPDTEYAEGDKRFDELEVGDILYWLEFGQEGYKWVELEVTNGWHENKGHYHITCKNGKKKVHINFGPSNCGNVRNASENSIVWYYGHIIGTNKKSIYNARREVFLDKIADIKGEYDSQLRNLKRLEKLAETMEE